MELFLPADFNKLSTLKAGDFIYLSGTIFTARDAAHKKLNSLLDENKSLPIDLTSAAIYYAGPCPAAPNDIIGSCGPTTSGRMDKFAPRLIELGLKCMIGKGPRSGAVIDAIKKNNAVYFAAVGGAGAYYKKCVKENTLVAFEELLSEAIYKLSVEKFPVIVAVDTNGNSIYK